MSDVADFTVEPADNDRLATLCGQFDEHLKQIEKRLGVQIGHRGSHFRVSGEPGAVLRTRLLLDELYAMTEKTPVTPDQVHLALQESSMEERADAATLPVPRGDERAGASIAGAPMAAAENAARVLEEGGVEPGAVDERLADGSDNAGGAVSEAPAPRTLELIKTRRVTLQCRGQRQSDYVASIKERDLTFGIGPAGTGKTFLAVACAVEALEADRVQRLVLVRPAVEAGERLGFLPGDMMQKVDPYLRPIYDALYEFIGIERVTKLVERNVIEIAPLAYMRGRTLNHSFVIMDEAQNTTVEQMKMFLTRIGFGSSAVVTGDTTQVDLPKHQLSGLKHVQEVLAGVEGIGFCRFTAADVVRHPLVQRIVAAYDRIDEAEQAAKGAAGS